MAVKIRLSRLGRTHAPVYRIVAVDSRSKRDGACIENLGTYNPLSHELIQFKRDRIDYWISQGAIATPVVEKLYKKYKKEEASV